MNKRLILAPILALLTACAPAPAPDTRATDEAAVRAADEQWMAAINKHDVDATVSFYTSDALVLPPNGPMLNTPQAIREAWTGMLAPGVTIAGQTAKVEAARSGEMAYVYGTYTMTSQDPKAASAVVDKGKYLEVWKKQADGTWKCAVDTFNSDLPVPAPPAK